MKVVIDSSVLVALLDSRDHWRTQALELQDALLDTHVIPVYLDCVAAEAISATARRLHEKDRSSEVNVVIDQLQALTSQHPLTWILPDVPRLYTEVLDLMPTSSGELNFNDALIALVCREREIPAIASFDADFDQVAWLKRVTGPEDL
jgi:predicted nucleic acid-binding protein